VARGLLRYRRFHGRVHLLAYRGAGGPAANGRPAKVSASARARSVAERRLGPTRRR
jgi:hypothetical protein